MIFYILVLTFFYGLYLYFTKTYDHWTKTGIRYVKPKLFVGNMGPWVTKNVSPGLIITDLYRKFKNEPYIGIFNIRQPVLLINDLEIIRNILVKQFNKFRDNSLTVNENIDPLMAKSPFFARGEKWKLIRNQLTPLMTTAKIKSMFPLIQGSCKNMMDYLKECTVVQVINVEKLGKQFTIDNYASCTFGVEGNSFNDDSSEFKVLAGRLLKFSSLGIRKFILFKLFPGLTDFFKMPIFDKETTIKLGDLVRKTENYRQENSIKRNDFLEWFIELKSKPMSFKYTTEHTLAYVLTLFVNMTETSALTLSYALLELAANVKIQNRLRDEIDSTLKKYDQITYDVIQEIDYLDAVCSETLRKYPPLIIISRECTEDFAYSLASGQILKLEKGSHVYIPVFGLHRDDRHYPDPQVFYPDRFLGESKTQALKNCYFPFGDGPRMCIGNKFAIMQIKSALVAILSDFDVKLSDKTSLPLEFGNHGFILAPKDGVWLNFCKRS